MTQPVLQEHPLRPETRTGAIWHYSPEHPKLPHFHGQLEFLVVKRGRLVERIGGRLYHAHAQQLVWHVPGLAHDLVDASSDLQFRIVHIEPALVAAVASAGLLAGLEGGRHDVFAAWPLELGRYVAGRPVIELQRRDYDALLNDCEERSDETGVFIDATARTKRALRSAWCATRTDHDDLQPNSLVELACGLLIEDASLDRRQLCRQLDVSGGYLSRRFAAELAITLQEQRARLRVLRFLALAMSGRNWLEAALSAGFGSYSQLHRVFVRLVGMSPRKYLSHGGRNQRALVPA